MNICILTRSEPAHRGKKAMFHQDILGSGLIKKGHEVTIITTGRKDGIESEKKDGISIFYLEGTPPDVYSKQFWTESAQKFEKLHKIKNFDIIVSESAGGFGCLRYKIPKKYEIPFVLILHNAPLSVIRTTVTLGLVDTLLAIKNQLIFYVKSLRNLHASSDAIICVSDYLKKNLLSLPGIKNKDKVYVVYNGVDVDVFKPWEKTKNLEEKWGVENGKIVLYVGRVAKEKGIQFAIQALPKVVKEIRNTKFVVVGEGNYVWNLKSLTKKMGVEKHVVFTGGVPHPELVNYYNIADVVILPSIRESLPFVLLEAMACRKPVVASRTGGIPEIVKNGENGYLVPVKNSKELAKKITCLLNRDELQNKFGENGRNRVLEKFTLEKMIDGTEQVLKQQLKNVKISKM